MLNFCAQYAVECAFLSQSVEGGQPEDDAQAQSHKKEYEPLQAQTAAQHAELVDG